MVELQGGKTGRINRDADWTFIQNQIQHHSPVLGADNLLYSITEKPMTLPIFSEDTTLTYVNITTL